MGVFCLVSRGLLYCPVTFAHSNRTSKPKVGDVTGLIEAAQVLVERGTTITLVSELKIRGRPDAAAWTLDDESERAIPEAFRRGIPGGVKQGIVINGSAFDEMRGSFNESDVRNRLGEVVTHEFGHLAGLDHIVCEGDDITSAFMCPGILPNASAQQFQVSYEQCEAFYLSDALENDQIQGLDDSIVTRGECQ